MVPPNADVASNDLAEQALLEQADKYPAPAELSRRARAAENFFTGKSSSSVQDPDDAVTPVSIAPVKRKRGRQPTDNTPVEANTTAAGELAQLLLSSQERITLTFDSLTLQFSVFVYVSEDAATLTLLGWGANQVQLKLHDMASQVIKVTRQSGQVYDAMYLGASVTLGLHGTLISFMLVEHDDQNWHTTRPE
jgi:hypothetical protein